MKSERVPYPGAFAGNARRRMVARAFVIVYAALVALGVYKSHDIAGGFHDEAFLYYTMFSVGSWLFTPCFCFSLFAPAHLSREALEELFLTRTSKRDFAKSLMRAPLGVFITAAVLNLCGFAALLIPYALNDSASHWWQIPPLMLTLIVGAQIVSISAAIRVWSANPRPVIRLFILAPLLAVWKGGAIFFMMIDTVLLMDKLPDRYNSSFLYVSVFAAGCISFAIVSLRRAVHHRDVLLFCEVDPEPCRRACWTANEKWNMAALRRVINLAFADHRAMAQALLVTMLVMVVLAIQDANTPIHIFYLGYHEYPVYTGPRVPDFILMMLPGTVMVSGIFAISFVYFVSRKNSEQRVPILAGGIIPTIAAFSLPPIFFFIVYTAGRFLAVSASGSWTGTLRSNQWSSVLVNLNVGAFIVAIVLIVFCVALTIPRRRQFLSRTIASLFVLGIPILYAFTLVSNTTSVLFRAIGECGLMILAGWFAGFGFSDLAGRIHREVADLPRGTFNTGENFVVRKNEDS